MTGLGYGDLALFLTLKRLSVNKIENFTKEIVRLAHPPVVIGKIMGGWAVVPGGIGQRAGRS